MENEISLEEFDKIIDGSRSAFLCGNGFSINFDWDFATIFERLYDAHNKILTDTTYKLKSSSDFKQKCKENFTCIKRKLNDISESDMKRIFDDALVFAESIQNNTHLTDEMLKSGLITDLIFQHNQVDILNHICKIGRNEGVHKVNIEYWTTLIYFYFVIKKITPDYYDLPKDNFFIDLVEVGDVSLIDCSGKNDLIEKVLLNGLAIYYRFLFSIAIYSNGRATEKSLLRNLDTLNLAKIKDFLEQFNSLLTLNYDHIVENITNKKVVHLHGEFVKGKKEYVHHQHLGLSCNQNYISLSDILIGDYFIMKVQSNLISYYASRGKSINKPIELTTDKINKVVAMRMINTFVIFGMSIANDQHILRGIMSAFFHNQIKNPRIIYCYYKDEEKKEFSEQYKLCITFSEEMNQYVENIKVDYIKTEHIRNRYFLKNTPVEIGSV